MRSRCMLHTPFWDDTRPWEWVWWLLKHDKVYCGHYISCDEFLVRTSWKLTVSSPFNWKFIHKMRQLLPMFLLKPNKNCNKLVKRKKEESVTLILEFGRLFVFRVMINNKISWCFGRIWLHHFLKVIRSLFEKYYNYCIIKNLLVFLCKTKIIQSLWDSAKLFKIQKSYNFNMQKL